MKILYIAMKHDYGNPDKGFSFEHYNFYETLTQMNGGEHEVIYFAFDEVMRDVGRDEMNQKLVNTAYREKPDLCFFMLFTDEIKEESVKEITKKSGAVTFNWFADDHWRFYNFSRYWAPLFSWVSTTDSRAVSKYEKIGYKNVIKTQWACNHFEYKKISDELKYDVTFVGQPYGNRREIVDMIRSAGISVECWGEGWPNGRIRQDEMIKLFSESRVNLNLTKSSGVFGVKPLAKVFLNKRTDNSYQLYNPRLWPDNIRSLLAKQREQIKGRNFEVLGSGGFLLTSEADNLTDYFTDGKEIVIFRNTIDLIDKAKYYLEHESERSAITEAGYKRTLRDHTYEKRFNEIFKAIGLIK